jgi:predicted CXXCH cytochrome family protein
MAPTLPGVWTLLPAAAGLLAAAVLVRRLGWARGASLGAVLVAALAGGAWLLDRRAHPGPRPGGDGVTPVTSADCAACHDHEYTSWHRSYHRTMTRDASPEDVKGDFSGALLRHQGLTTRLTRDGDDFFMETVSPDRALLRARAGDGVDGAPPSVRFRVDRLVGSHWLQEYLHLAPNGRYVRLPVLYHLGERRWLPSKTAFLTPDTDDFWSQSRGAAWNDSCLYCHNTGPTKNPERGPRGEVVGYDTTVAELGIACEACHGPGGEHVRLERRSPPPDSDPAIVHPARLPVPRRDEVCARCHGALVPKPSAWDPVTQRDPFVPGQELTRYNHLFWSEAEQAELVGRRPPSDRPPRPGPTDGRFWGDGTPLTTALEYNGMALSACYQNGRGRLSCLSCHTMHGNDPSFMLKPGMRTNEACYQCHGDYRARLAEHTRHAPDSAGSLCYNCHMPYQVYSLMTTHRSHRIQVPDLESSLGTGKPNACTLCHLDKSLGWTRDQLARWPNRARVAQPKLSADEEGVAAAVLTLARGDARSRVVVAGAFSDPAARRASGDDWFGPFLTRLLEGERYPAVRYLAHRGLRAACGEAKAGPFDYTAVPAERAEQLRALRARFDAAPLRRPLPYLPLTPQGLPDEAVLQRLRANRSDPDLTINE